MSTASSESLYESLAEALATDNTFHFHHISTPPTRCEPLFAAPPGRKPERTYCESNFLTVSIVKEQDTPTIVFGIEILVFTTRRLTTIFVSKADSTGCLASLGLPQTTQSSPVRVITSTFISWLVETRQRPHARLVVSLFARAQDQYLFPGSVSNKGKHVLDDRQLLKWWCKTLDPVLRRREHRERARIDKEDAAEETKAEAHVIVPGFDKHETTAFFPSSWRADPPEARKWRYGHPLRDIAPVPMAPPRCLVPRFPDDPKARFVDELDEEIPDNPAGQKLASPSKKGSGMWKSCKTLEQFWETMAFRQECSSGRMVGFIWVVFTPPDVDSEPGYSLDSQDSFMSRASTPLGGLGEIPSISEVLSPSSAVPNSPRKRKRTPLTGPIMTRAPKVKCASGTQPSDAQPEKSPFWRWPRSSRGQIVVEKQAYDRIHDLLLKLDFCDNTAARHSTKKWLDEVVVTAGRSPLWGQAVTGRRAHAISAKTVTVSSGTVGQPNNLSTSIVRKKQKPGSNGAVAAVEAAKPAEAPAVNVLSSSMIRKKPKVR
ncbi:hypothetical protein MBLNU457_6842t1 [Dothideomycetes sp. NU457]